MVGIRISLADAQATRRLGKALGQLLPQGSIILLAGALGAGKTTLVGGIGAGLGIKEPITSPTFTLINEYQGRLPLYHLDLYRLNSQEAESIYPEIYWEGVEVSPGITAIEWACRLSYRPTNYLEIRLTNRQAGRIAHLIPVGVVEIDWATLQQRCACPNSETGKNEYPPPPCTNLDDRSR